MKSQDEIFIDYLRAKTEIYAVQCSLELRLEKIKGIDAKSDVIKDLEDMIKMLRRSWVAFSDMEQRYRSTYKALDKLDLESEVLREQLKQQRELSEKLTEGL